jgi:hypothetical protein
MIERCNEELKMKNLNINIGQASVHFKLKEESEESARKAVAYFRIDIVTATSVID